MQRCIQNQPAALRARAQLISLYLDVGDAKQAMNAAQEALGVSPESRELLALAGRAALAAGERNQAVATFEKLASLESRSVAPLLMLTDALVANHDRDNAIVVLKRALKLQEDSVDVQVRLIQLYLADRRTTEALAVARNIQRQRPNDATGYRAEADVLLKAQDYQEAAKVLEKGFKLTSSWVFVPPLHKT